MKVRRGGGGTELPIPHSDAVLSLRGLLWEVQPLGRASDPADFLRSTEDFQLLFCQLGWVGM